VTLRTARVLTGIYFGAMLAAVTWPGALLFVRVRPFVLGLPFSFAWIALWILSAVFVLWGLDRVERRYRAED
jgi:hypothetical protein